MSKHEQININKIVSDAFSGFKNWWIPLCAITATIFISQSWIPHFLFQNLTDKQKITMLKNSLTAIKEEAVASGDPHTAITHIRESLISFYSQPEIHAYIEIFMLKLILILLIVSLLLCFLYIIVILISKKSILNTNDKITFKKNMRRYHTLSLSYLTLCIIKAVIFLIPFLILLLYIIIKFAFNTSTDSATMLQTTLLFYYILEITGVFILVFFMIILSIYTYIRLYFTGFIITEESSNPFKSILKSWKITKYHTGKLSIIFILTIIIDIISVISVIGFIPGTGIKYTLRASAYKQCLEIGF